MVLGSHIRLIKCYLMFTSHNCNSLLWDGFTKFVQHKSTYKKWINTENFEKFYESYRFYIDAGDTGWLAISLTGTLFCWCFRLLKKLLFQILLQILPVSWILCHSFYFIFKVYYVNWMYMGRTRNYFAHGCSRNCPVLRSWYSCKTFI